MRADRWLSAYLVYEEPWRDLLRDGVRPFVIRAEADGLIDRFFFVRYHERGSHIRLRMRVAPDVAAECVSDTAARFFGEYMAARPSSVRTIDVVDPLPVNSVQFIPYEPELERYGGEELIDVAEEQFDASSRAVLALIDDGWSYERALSAAMWMHLTFAIAAPMKSDGAAWFFDQAIGSFAHWHRIDLPELLRTFEQRFEPQREQLTAQVRELWEALHEEIDIDWLRDWRDAMSAVHDAVRARAEQPLPILLSYLHMTNNRLGLVNRDEAWLAFLLSRALR